MYLHFNKVFFLGGGMLILTSNAFANPYSGRTEPEYTIGAYALTENIDADVGAPQDLSIDFQSIWDNKNLLFTLYGGYQNQMWGLYIDYSKVKLDKNNAIGNVFDAKVGTQQIDVYGTYQLSTGTNWYLDLTFGVRNYDYSIELSTQQENLPEVGDDWTHATLGLKHQIGINENWYWTTRTNVGTDFDSSESFKINSGLGYSWRNGWDLILTYNLLVIDYETDSGNNDLPFTYDAIEHGFLFGLSYAW